MVSKKRKSKRITTRKREKIAKNIRRHNRKVRHKNRKERRKIAVPPSVLWTIDEEMTMKKIKEDAEYRQRLHELSSKGAKAKTLTSYVEGCDVVLELIDSRDPTGSASEELASILRVVKRPYYKVYCNTSMVPHEVLARWLVHEKAFVEADFEKLCHASASSEDADAKILIVGNSNLKEQSFLCQKLPERLKLERFITECRINTPSVLRGACKLNKNNCREVLDNVVGKFNKESLLLKYKVPDFSSSEELLRLVGSKNRLFSRSGKVDITKAGLWLLNDIMRDYVFFVDTDKDLRLLERSSLEMHA